VQAFSSEQEIVSEEHPVSESQDSVWNALSEEHTTGVVTQPSTESHDSVVHASSSVQSTDV